LFYKYDNEIGDEIKFEVENDSYNIEV